MLMLFGPDLSTVLKWLGYESLLLLRQPKAISGLAETYLIGEMLTSGALVTLDQFLVLNQSFYQTVITFLIFLNGLFAIVSFTFIRATASEKVSQEISDKLKEIDKNIENKLNDYIQTQRFNLLVKDASKDKLEYIEKQLGRSEEMVLNTEDKMLVIEQSLSKLDLSDEIEYLKQELASLKH